MTQRNLQELLQEDQEPFLLKDYIDNRRSQLKRPSVKTQLQVKKRKSISATSNFPGIFCKNACLFSFHDSPDLRKSPIFEFQSPAKTPCKSPNRIFLQIPARTAAALLEASLRIQKQKTQNKSHGFGLFGSFLKKLTHNSRTRKRKIEGDGVKVSVKDILKWDSSVGLRNNSNGIQRVKEKFVVLEDKQCVSEITCCQTSFSCPCTGRPSSGLWSESNEEKSSDLESSCSSQSEESEAIEFITKLREGADFACCGDNGFCKSPFHFVLQRSPSPGRRKPEFSSPMRSPNRHKKEDKINYDLESLKKIHGDEVEQEDKEKEQCSPVSVLDPPFEDDDNSRDHESGGDFDMEGSYAIVQRTKQQLLQKLRRFEKLAKLDPTELDKIMLEQDEGDSFNTDDMDEEEEEEEEEEEDHESIISDCEANEDDSLIGEVLHKSSAQYVERIPENLKRLVCDLIVEEGKQIIATEKGEVVTKRVWKRLESWKEVESNTIDMMVSHDLKELDGWKNNQEQMGKTAIEIELAIYGLLVDELAAELCLLIK